MRVEADDGVGLEVVHQGEGPGLLLVHGFGGAKEDFTDHVEALARSHQVVAFDHRGTGASDKPAHTGSYSLRRLAEDAVAVADAVGMARFRLLGHSLGGMIAQEVVLEHPDRVEALVLMDTWPGPPNEIDPAMVETAAEIALGQGMAALHERMDEGGVLPTPAHERLLRERPGYKEFNDRKFLAQAPEMYATLAREMVRRPDLSEALRAVACPTLVIVGEDDRAALPGARRLAEVIPGARLARIRDAGHSPQFENPIAWRSVVTGFLSEVSRANQ